jgi:hypothetical protein
MNNTTSIPQFLFSGLYLPATRFVNMTASPIEPLTRDIQKRQFSNIPEILRFSVLHSSANIQRSYQKLQDDYSIESRSEIIYWCIHLVSALGASKSPPETAIPKKSIQDLVSDIAITAVNFSEPKFKRSLVHRDQDFVDLLTDCCHLMISLMTPESTITSLDHPIADEVILMVLDSIWSTKADMATRYLFPESAKGFRELIAQLKNLC